MTDKTAIGAELKKADDAISIICTDFLDGEQGRRISAKGILETALECSASIDAARLALQANNEWNYCMVNAPKDELVLILHDYRGKTSNKVAVDMYSTAKQQWVDYDSPIAWKYING